jgi:hypothetical protein
LNGKHEIRNPKLETNPKFQIGKEDFCAVVSNLLFLFWVIVSDFVLRISDLLNRVPIDTLCLFKR